MTRLQSTCKVKTLCTRTSLTLESDVHVFIFEISLCTTKNRRMTITGLDVKDKHLRRCAWLSNRSDRFSHICTYILIQIYKITFEKCFLLSKSTIIELKRAFTYVLVFNLFISWFFLKHQHVTLSEFLISGSLAKIFCLEEILVKLSWQSSYQNFFSSFYFLTAY